MLTLIKLFNVKNNALVTDINQLHKLSTNQTRPCKLRKKSFDTWHKESIK